MKTYLLPFILLFFLSACSSKENSDEFINATEGRYLFNENEIIEIYFKDKVLLAKWRGLDDIELLKVDDSSFYMKELNEKIVFVKEPKMHIELDPKKEHKGQIYHFKKLKKGEKTPNEYFEESQYDKALEAFVEIKRQDSLSPIIREYSLNRVGYKYLRDNNIEKAIEIFKINTVLHPKSSNTFDSLGDAYLKAKDTTNAIKSYTKSLSINSENRSSKRMLEKITKK